MCCIRAVYAKLFVSKFLFIGGQIRTATIILSSLSQLHLMGSVPDQSIPTASSLRCHDDGMPAFHPGKLWIIPRICSSSSCRQLRASVLETTSFLSGHEWQEASSFRSEILSRGHLFTSYFSFLVIVDTWDVLQPAFRTYSSPYMSRVYCRAVSPWPGSGILQRIPLMQWHRSEWRSAQLTARFQPCVLGFSQSFDGLRILKFPDSFDCFLRMFHKLGRLFPDLISSFHTKGWALRNYLINQWLESMTISMQVWFWPKKDAANQMWHLMLRVSVCT